MGTLQNEKTESRRWDCRDFANERVCIVCQGDPRKILGPAHDCVPPGREETELASP